MFTKEVVATEDPKSALDTEDFRAYEAAFEAERLSGSKSDDEVEEKPAVGEEDTPPSVPAKAGQTAAESEPEEEAEQEEEEEEEEEEVDSQAVKPVRGEENNKRLARRMRTLTGTIKTLESRLAELAKPAESDEEAEEEVVSSTAEVEPAVKAVAPKLKDFEDTDEASAWDQYEAAKEAFHEGETAKAIKAALTEQKKTLDQEFAKQAEAEAKKVSDFEWGKAAARFDDYNEVVREEVQVSPAMIAVLKAVMDAETGTAVSYYLGQHPEESKAIATETLADSAPNFERAKLKAAIKLAAIAATLKPPVKTAPGTKPKAAATPAPVPPLKKITTAKPPPPQIRGGTVPPKFDTSNEDDAADFKKWDRERTRQLAADGKR